MFCQKCGSAITVVAGVAAVCPSCHTPLAQAPATASSAAVADTMKATSRDALAAFKRFALDPVGGLAPACESVGNAKALRAGVAFGVVSLVCFLLGGYLMLPPYFKEDLFEVLGFGGVMKCLLFGVAPFLCATIGSLAVRKVLGGQGSLASDSFIAGAALLPISFWMLLAGLVGWIENYEVVAALMVFAGTTGVLMLFAGLTRISKLGERAGALAVPTVVLVSLWLVKLLANSVLGGPGSSFM
jgi:hypothetical protein